MGEMKVLNTCEFCRFWCEQYFNVGECRRHAPIATQQGNIDRGGKWQDLEPARWPATDKLDSCGDFELKGP